MSISPLQTRTAEYRVFQALGENCGLVLTDPSTGECVFRFRQDFETFAGEEAPVLLALSQELPERQKEMGTTAFLAWIDDNLSNALSVEPPTTTLALDLERTAQALYRRMVNSTVRRYQTHLPFYSSLDIAAGGLGQDRANTAQEWVEAHVPGRRGLSEDLFLVRIHGRSMMPDIPDGSLCVFRSYYGGSRKGGIFIVQRMATMDEGGEYTLKRYSSQKEQTAEGWRHKSITMHPHNAEFSDWELREEDQYVTIAEFICVLEDPPVE
ncbi:MAG: S24 family peptidase [Acidobacteria bacterium]|nr:S24 family peptidase [Acidobacteriota bacterium]